MLTTAYDNKLENLRSSFEERQTTQDLVASYLLYAQHVRGMRPSTLKARAIYLRQFYNHFGESPLELLTNMDLDIYFVEMANKVSIHTGKKLSIGTVNTSKRVVKGFLKWCSEYPEIPLKVKIGEIRELRREDTHPQILTHRQIIQVIKRTKNKQDKLMISVMYEAGLRISETIDLKIEHLRGCTLDVVGKGRKHRITYVTPQLAKQLRAWMDENGWEEGFVFRPLMHGGGEVGYVHTDTVRQRIKRLFWSLAGVVMHPHLLRHAFALRLLRQGVDLRSIQKLLGHSNIETTMAYLGIDDQYLERQYKRFGVSVYA